MSHAQGNAYLLSESEIYEWKQTDYAGFVLHNDEAIRHYTTPLAADTLFMVYEQYLTGLMYYTEDFKKLGLVRSAFFDLYQTEFVSKGKTNSEYAFRYNFIACGVSNAFDDHKQTERHALQAISVFDQFPDSIITAALALQYVKTYFMLCGSYVATGKYEEALQANRYLLYWVTEYYGEDHRYWNLIIKQIDAAFAMEKYAEAYDQYQLQYSNYLLQKNNRRSEKVGLLLKLSDICLRINDSDGYHSFMRDVKSQIESRDEKVYYQYNLGNHALKQDTNAAILHFDQAIIHDSMYLSAKALDIHHTLALIYAKQRDLEKSKYHFKQLVWKSSNPNASDQQASSENPDALLISAYSELLKIAQWESDQSAADHYAAQLMSSIMQIKNNDYFLNDKIRLFNQTYDYFGQLIAYYSERDQMDHVFSVFRQSKAQLLKESMIKRKNNRFGSYEEELLVTALKTQLQDETITEQKRKLIEAEIYKVREKMNYHIAPEMQSSLDDLMSQDSISLSEFKSELRQGTVILEYYLGSECSYAMVIDRDDVQLISLPADTIIQNAVLHYLKANRAKVDLSEAAEEIKHMIWPPSLDIEAYDFLTIIPDGIIHYFPFEALSVSQGYLIDQVSVSYQLYSDMAMINSPKRHREENRLFAVAPTFSVASDSVDHAQLTELSYNRKEVESILTNCDGVSLIDTSATKQNFLQQYQDYNLYHFSTHAVIGESPDESYIAFYHRSDDDRLYQYEVESLAFDADMVVLSACETGIGTLLKGESMFSLKKAFMQSGCQSVISSLWSVNDQCTAEIMDYFYQHLNVGIRKDEALRQAKLDYLSVADPQYKHPFYWAGFTVVGDIAPVYSASGMGYFLSIGAVAGLLCIFLVALYCWRRFSV